LIEKLDSNGKNATTNTIDKTLYKKSEVVHALREYQDYMSIPATGIVDQNTIKKINQKRCGMPDRIPRSNFHVKMSLTKSGRTKRDTNVFRKGGHSFTNPSSGKKVYYWNIKPYPKLKSYIRPNIWHTLEYAFNRWASVTAIDFIRGDYLGYSDIEVGFWSSKY
jgi:Putative peptidoglycan binding domain.